MKSITDNGVKTDKMASEFISGLRQEEKISTLETVMKGTGKTEKDVDLVSFTMLTVLNMKGNGRITLKKVSHFSVMKMVRSLKDYLKMIE